MKSAEPATVVRANRRRFGYLIAKGCVVTLVSILLLLTARNNGLAVVVGWIGTTVFGIATLIFGCQFVDPPALSIDRFGFVVIAFRRSHRVAWTDTSPFVVRPRPSSPIRAIPVALAHKDAVYFDYVIPPRNGAVGRIRAFNRSVAGHDGMLLADNFGLAPEELAEMLNRHRRAALHEAS